eukprot:Gb_02434 [translate_table: standard]
MDRASCSLQIKPSLVVDPARSCLAMASNGKPVAGQWKTGEARGPLIGGMSISTSCVDVWTILERGQSTSGGSLKGSSACFYHLVKQRPFLSNKAHSWQYDPTSPLFMPWYWVSLVFRVKGSPSLAIILPAPLMPWHWKGRALEVLVYIYGSDLPPCLFCTSYISNNNQAACSKG